MTNLPKYKHFASNQDARIWARRLGLNFYQTTSEGVITFAHKAGASWGFRFEKRDDGLVAIWAQRP